MNKAYIKDVEPIIFDSYQEFKQWVYPRNQGVSFMADSIIGFKNKEDDDKFNRVYKIDTRYDSGAVKYTKV